MTVSLLHSVPADGSFSAAGAAAWDAQHVFTQATDRLLGRTTAGVGATEEISVGAGLTLSGGTLVNAGATSPIGGSDTQVQFNDGGVFAGNANFTFNKATNQIAIAAGSAAAPTLIPTGDTNTGVWFPAADTIAASTGGTERFRILSSGNVGIGTTAPQARLQVNSEIRVADGTTIFRTIPSGGVSFFGNITDHPIVVQTNNIERIRILNGGNVGIGTSSPTTLLSVNGVASFGAGTAALPSVAAFGDLDTGMWFPAANTIAWSTNGIERMRINSSGNIGIGVSNPLTILQLTSSAAFGAQVSISSTAVDAFGPIWTSEKFRGAATANAGDTLGSFTFRSLDTGGTARNAASLSSVSQGAGATWHSARFDFNSVNASGTSATRLRVGDDGILLPAGAASLPSISQLSDTNTGMWFPAADTLAWSTGGSERLRITSAGNLGLGTSTFGTSAATTFAIATGTAPTTGPADTIQIYSTDLSAGNTMLSLYTEGTVVNANVVAAATHRIAIRVNGTVYYLLANTAA